MRSDGRESPCLRSGHRLQRTCSRRAAAPREATLWTLRDRSRVSAFCRRGDCAVVVRGRPGRQGYEPARVGTIRDAALAACRTELRHRELTCEATRGWLKGEPSSGASAFTSIVARRIGSQQSNPAPAESRRGARVQPPKSHRIVPIARVGISRCQTDAASRSAQSAIGMRCPARGFLERQPGIANEHSITRTSEHGHNPRHSAVRCLARSSGWFARAVRRATRAPVS